MKRIAILFSGLGRGSNMAAIAEACSRGEINGSVELVIASRRDAPAYERSLGLNLNTIIIDPRCYPETSVYDHKLLDALETHEIDIICLAGYLRVLPKVVVEMYKNKCLNIHPSLLPLFCGKGMYGMKVHQAVIESGMKVSGCTVHFVDNEYDSGPIALQTCVPVEDGDTAETLAERVLQTEHKTYVKAVKLICEESFKFDGQFVLVKE